MARLPVLHSSLNRVSLHNSLHQSKLGEIDHIVGRLQATVARVMDTGNVVLEDNHGREIWNSFNSSVTDTLLPNQYLQRTDKRQSTLTSWLSRDDPATGSYSFGWGTINGTNGSILQLACQTCKTESQPWGVYIPAPDMDNPHIISNVDSVYFHQTLGGLYFPTSTPVNSSKSPLPPASTLIFSGKANHSNPQEQTQ